VSNEEESVIYSTTGAVATITLNRPEALNAFDRELAMHLDAALRTAERDPEIRAVILTGAGRAFSAGQDVRELARETAAGGPEAVGIQMRERFNPIVIRIRTIEKPVIAAINGITTGAGLGIALACDYRIAAATASIVLAPLGVGFIPAVGTSILLPAIVGLGRASELALLGERITADKALQYGIVSQIVPEEELQAVSMALAERFVSLPTKTIGLTKRAFNHAFLPHLQGHLDFEAGLQEVAAGTNDHKEGLAAILEKRAPHFAGS
jgi:2-(1,2-epoxy-1,2-dihydrophenyl)acetyl-CoA isomerase